jgi:DNA-binding FadR family transcriptional regulator
MRRGAGGLYNQPSVKYLFIRAVRPGRVISQADAKSHYAGHSRHSVAALPVSVTGSLEALRSCSALFVFGGYAPGKVGAIAFSSTRHSKPVDLSNEHMILSAVMEVKLRTLPTQVAGVLVRRIATGLLTDGLAPSEQQISQEFSVSRAVAREALKILASLDMVEIAQGRRVMLRPIAEWDYMSPLLIEWLPQDQILALLHELHEARLMFEPAIAAEAARSLTPETLKHLGEMLKVMVSTEHNPDAYLELDLEFHMELCRAARNRFLERFMYASRGWQSASRRITNRAPRALTIATEQHRVIYEALVARDPARAEAAMRAHLIANPMSHPVTELISEEKSG